jgi:tetrahydromethanopterin S-methyltransferase subunit C
LWREVEMSTSISSFLRGAAPVPWFTVAAFAVLMDVAAGFWLTSIQGAVGAIERAQTPFASWLRISTLMLPVFVLAVLTALPFARRRFGPALRTTRRVVAAALLMVAAGTVVGVGQLAVSAAYDYRLQAQHLELIHAIHPGAHVHDDGSCVGLCAAKRATLALDARAVAYGSAAVLGTNIVLVAWVVALRGGRLDPVRPRRPAMHTAG